MQSSSHRDVFRVREESPGFNNLFDRLSLILEDPCGLSKSQSNEHWHKSCPYANCYCLLHDYIIYQVRHGPCSQCFSTLGF